MATSNVTAAGAHLTAPRKETGWGRHKELLRELVRRDLQARYRGSLLGMAWSLLNPLVYMVIYTLVFSTIMRFPLSGAPYPLFLLSGLLAWNFFSQALAGSVNSVLGNSSLVKKVAFPWVLLTLASVIAAFINYLISLVLLVPLLLVYHIEPGVWLLAIPFLAAITFMFSLGLSLLVAAANVYFRDVEYLLTIALQAWFFVTPIIYSLYGHGKGKNIKDSGILSRIEASHSVFAPVFKYVLYLNPMTWIETAFQDVIAFRQWPQDIGPLSTVALLSVVTMIAGLAFFEKLQGHFAEEL